MDKKDLEIMQPYFDVDFSFCPDNYQMLENGRFTFVKSAGYQKKYKIG
jgi:hypothetical protein